MKRIRGPELRFSPVAATIFVAAVFFGWPGSAAGMWAVVAHIIADTIQNRVGVTEI